MSAKNDQVYIGAKAAYLVIEKLVFYVTVLDVKRSYGSMRMLIRPVAGGGQAWVDRGSLVLDVPVEQQWVAEAGE